MATYTENYNLKMPSGQDAPDVEDFNTNAEIIDTVLKAHSDNTADEYSPDETYTAGRLVIQNNALWKAKQDISVAETWTPDHWELTTLAAELSAVNSRLNWKDLGGVVQGEQSVDMSSLGDNDFSEISIAVWTGNGIGERDYYCTIPRSGIASTDSNAPAVIIGGYYVSPTDYGVAMVRVSRQSVSIHSFYHGGQQVAANNRSLRVRYR